MENKNTTMTVVVVDGCNNGHRGGAGLRLLDERIDSN